MRAITKFAAAGVVAFSALSFASAASAATEIEIAAFLQKPSNTKVITYNSTGVGVGALTDKNTVAGTGTLVNFFFQDLGLVDIAGDSISAFFDMDANINGGTFTVGGSGVAEQTGFDGYFEFTSQNAFTANSINYAAGTVLLRGDFVNGWLRGQTTGPTANSGNYSTGGTANFTSDVMDLSSWSGFNYSFTLTNATPGFVDGGGYLNDFTADSTGNFGAAIPEPGTWALMIIGFGGAGAMIRSRRRATVAA